LVLIRVDLGLRSKKAGKNREAEKRRNREAELLRGRKKKRTKNCRKIALVHHQNPQ